LKKGLNAIKQTTGGLELKETGTECVPNGECPVSNRKEERSEKSQTKAVGEPIKKTKRGRTKTKSSGRKPRPRGWTRKKLVPNPGGKRQKTNGGKSTKPKMHTVGQ